MSVHSSSHSVKVALGLLITLTAAPRAVLAIGPNTQTISPTYNRVVRILSDAGLGGGQGFMEGTGSIVANQNVGGSGYLWVLTADHVVSQTASRTGAAENGLGIAFGNSPTGSGNSTYFSNATAAPDKIYRHGPTGLEDIALFAVNYGAYDPANDALAVNLISPHGLPSFSDIGFGNQGNATASGYQAQNSYGTQRYYNQKVTAFAPIYNDPTYTYRAYTFTIQNPSDAAAPAGSGAALDADSGSPWFSSDFNGTYFTNGQVGILTSVTPAPSNGLFAYGSTERALAFSVDDLAWVASIVAVPEPGFVAIVLFAVVVPAVRPRRRLHR